MVLMVGGLVIGGKILVVLVFVVFLMWVWE